MRPLLLPTLLLAAALFLALTGHDEAFYAVAMVDLAVLTDVFLARTR